MNKKQSELRSYSDIDDGGASAVREQTGQKKKRVDKRDRTVRCRFCDTEIKFRGPGQAALNLDDSLHRCGAEARMVANDKASSAKEITDALKTLYKVAKHVHGKD